MGHLPDGTALRWGSIPFDSDFELFDDPFVTIAAGNFHGIGLSLNGNATLFGHPWAKDGTPTNEHFSQIAAGRFHTVGLTANPDIGVCCFGSDCILSNELLCNSMYGTWLGPDATCATHSIDDCGDPIGACCLNSGCDQVTEAQCDQLGGSWAGVGTGCAICEQPCEADINRDQAVEMTDLLMLLERWGACP